MSTEKKSSPPTKLSREQARDLLARLSMAIVRPECRDCDCLQGFLTQLELDAQEDIAEMTAHFKVKLEDIHGCLGCDPCPPGALFSEYLRAAVEKANNARKPGNLTISASVYEQMVAASRNASPLEACGLLAGRGSRVTKCYVLTNVDASPEHYNMKPDEQFAAVKNMRATGLKMLAIWHSHPASPARMSSEDIRLAYTPDVAYVILSLAEADRPVIRSFVVQNNTAYEIPTFIEQQESERA